MAASVWMTSWIGRPVLPLLISRPVPLITPAAGVWLGDTINQPYGAINADPQLPERVWPSVRWLGRVWS